MSYLKGVVTGFSVAACAAMLIANIGSGNATFTSIDVERINLREPDGTLRMVLSNRAAFPGLIHKGKERPHPGRTHAAGLLFFNDQGTADLRPLAESRFREGLGRSGPDVVQAPPAKPARGAKTEWQDGPERPPERPRRYPTCARCSSL